MDKASIYKLAPKVLKRMEYSIDKFYLLNFKNDEIWIGNYASFLIVSQIDGSKSIEQVVNDVQEYFEGFTYKQIYESTLAIIKELVEKKFLVFVR